MGNNWGWAGDKASQAGEQATVAGGEIAAAGEMSATSTRTAKAEMALLGEEIGVRIPRHLRGFVSELPGVGQALTAAFSATAVLMLLQILVTASEKLGDFLALVVYGADATKQQDDALKALNGRLVELSKEYVDLKKQIDDYGKSALQLAELKKQQVEKSVKDLTAQFKEEEAEMIRLDAVARDHTRTRLGLMAAYDKARSWSDDLVRSSDRGHCGRNTSSVARERDQRCSKQTHPDEQRVGRREGEGSRRNPLCDRRLQEATGGVREDHHTV